MNEEDIKIIDAMEEYGGSFVKALANVCRHADHYNLGKIRQAFHEYWNVYREKSEQLEKTKLYKNEPSKIKNNIICGFAGIGKSYLANKMTGWIDLESTPFNKNWDLYTDVAIHMQKNGYTPMVSCHKELREKLKEKGADYVVVIPKLEYKQKYIERYKERSNNEAFIKLFEQNFEKFIKEIVSDDEEETVIFLESENETLLDLT